MSKIKIGILYLRQKINSQLDTINSTFPYGDMTT